MKKQINKRATADSKKAYMPPKLTVYGSVVDITGWIGGLRGKSFGTQTSGSANGWHVFDDFRIS